MSELLAPKIKTAFLDLPAFSSKLQEKLVDRFRGMISFYENVGNKKEYSGVVITPNTSKNIVRNICHYSEARIPPMIIDGASYAILGVRAPDDMESIFSSIQREEERINSIIIASLGLSEAAIADAAAIAAELQTKLKKISRAIILGVIYGAAALSMRYLPYNKSGNVPAADAAYGIYNTFIPEVIVGTIPLYAVHNIEYGMSDLKIKYRAVGDVFLAHQQGSGRTLRIDGKLVGPYRYMYLAVLLGLQYKGQSENRQLANLDQLSAGIIGGGSFELSKEAEYEHHSTIPVITQTDISLDLYIQTLEWHQTVDTGGEKIVNYSILFRRYVEPDAVQAFNKDKVSIVTYGSTLSERLRNEALIDMFWKVGKIATEVVRVEFFDGKYTNRLNREAVYTDPYISSIQSLTQGAASEMYDWIMGSVGRGHFTPPSAEGVPLFGGG